MSTLQTPATAAMAANNENSERTGTDSSDNEGDEKTPVLKEAVSRPSAESEFKTSSTVGSPGSMSRTPSEIQKRKRMVVRKASVTSIESVDRGQWTGRFDFLMSMIAYAVGLGNVWRFPYLCFKNGGGSFLVVYAIFFCTCAVPIFIMEVTIGQYLQRGAMEIWQMCPLFKGVGVGNVVIAFMCIAYFCVIVSWALHYMINSLRSEFPWESCGNSWNTDRCIVVRGNWSDNGTNTVPEDSQTSVEEYWERRVLMQSSSITQFGGIQLELLGLMFIAWLIVYFALWKGITEARKFVYFCALFPYFLIAILLIRGLTLPGAMMGISYYLTPNITKLTETTVWRDAGTQVFYSYGVGFGALIALGSHNKFNHNCFRDAFIMCFINGTTSILAGLVVFSILGFMSHIAKKHISKIVKPGVGLAFVAYPEVASNLPLKQLWAFLFFLMIAILGLDSQICMMEGLFTAIEDSFPNLRKHKKISLGVISFIFFVIGIPMVSYAGVHWLTLIDAYGASGYALLWVVFFEVVGLAWGFGANNVRGALNDMIGLELRGYWNIIWKFISPTVTAILFMFCALKYEPLRYPDGEQFPLWAQLFGFGLSCCSMIAVPIFMLHYLFVTERDIPLKQKLAHWLHPRFRMRSEKIRKCGKGIVMNANVLDDSVTSPH